MVEKEIVSGAYDTDGNLVCEFMKEDMEKGEVYNGSVFLTKGVSEEDIKKIVMIQLPKDICFIRNGAFEYCSSLREVYFPEGLIKIGKGVFWGCDSIETIVLPNSIKEIDDWAFAYCRSLKTVILPKNIIKIRNSVFENCTALDMIIYDDMVYTNREKIRIKWKENEVDIGTSLFLRTNFEL